MIAFVVFYYNISVTNVPVIPAFGGFVAPVMMMLYSVLMLRSGRPLISSSRDPSSFALHGRFVDVSYSSHDMLVTLRMYPAGKVTRASEFFGTALLGLNFIR
jgi:hypothetical protein